jgi:hypothetical protein
MQHVSPKRRNEPSKLHGVRTQKITITATTAAMKTLKRVSSSVTDYSLVCENWHLGKFHILTTAMKTYINNY